MQSRRRKEQSEIAKMFMKDDYIRALRAARAGRVYIEPSRDDVEAIKFLAACYMAAEELSELGLDEYERIQEEADSTVPYNNYECGMIFAQLGLWYDNEDMIGKDFIDGIRYAIYDTALSIIINLNQMELND
tara:strand:- start:75 stop:470 length:396 start_codon:yes stop_codon:yes gene_type:complete